MKSFIKRDKYEVFKQNYVDFGFSAAYHKEFYAKSLGHGVFVIVHKRSRRLDIVTPLGASPFVESHKDKFKELDDQGYVEYKKTKYD